MTVDKIKAEILRVEKAIEKTKSDYLKNDYSKYLKKLKKQLKNAEGTEKNQSG